MLWALLCLSACREPEPDAEVKDTQVHADPYWIYSDSSALSGVNGRVRAVAIQDSDLYVAGKFTLAGRVAAGNIARWDGHRWTALGEGIGELATALAADSKGRVFVLSGVSKGIIQEWNGSRWYVLEGVFDGQVQGMRIDAQGRLLVYGNVQRIDSMEVGGHALWDGSSWTPIPRAGDLFFGKEGEILACSVGVDTIAVYRYGEKTWTQWGRAFRPEVAVEGRVHCAMDGSGRVVAAYRGKDGEGRSHTALSRLENDHAWLTFDLDLPGNPLDFLQPVPGDPERLWIGGERLSLFESDSVRTLAEYWKFDREEVHWDGRRSIKYGDLVQTEDGSKVFVAQWTGKHWVGLDTDGVSIVSRHSRAMERKLELFRRIPMDAHQSLKNFDNVSDILEDDGGGVYLAGSFGFEKEGVYHRGVTYVKDGSFFPLGGGLLPDTRRAMELAVCPDGTLYAANALLTAGVSDLGQPALFRFDGKTWNFVRTTPEINELGCDRFGDLYALYSKPDYGRVDFGRIPIGIRDGPLETIAADTIFTGGQPDFLELTDTLVHLYGDFHRVGGRLSFRHVAWRMPAGKGRIPLSPAKTDPTAPASQVPDTARIRIVLDYHPQIRIVDSIKVEHSERYSLYCATPRGFDTVYARLRRVDGLRVDHFFDKQEKKFLPAFDMVITPVAGEYHVKFIARDSITPRKAASLNLYYTGKTLQQAGPETYVLQDTVAPLVMDRFEVGNKAVRAVQFNSGFDLRIEAKDGPMDTMYRSPDFPVPVRVNLKLLR